MDWSPVLADLYDLHDRAAGVQAVVTSLAWTIWAPQTLPPSLEENRRLLSLLFERDADFCFVPPVEPDRRVALAYLTTMADNQVVSALGSQPYAALLGRVQPLATVGEVVEAVLSGCVVMLVDGAGVALALAAQGWSHREVQRPFLEATVRGSQEGFNEDLRTNVSMLRRRVKDPRLRLERLVLGRCSHTEVRLAYLQGVAHETIVGEARRRLGSIEVDSVVESCDLEEMIEDDPGSPFPQFLFTERPDRVAAGLMEGRFALFLDGTPDVLMAPVTYWSLMEAPDDHFQRFHFASFIRLLRYGFFFTALLLPSLYIAGSTFHQQMIPTTLLIGLAASREGIPFPAVVEAFIMELSLEVLREASQRLPTRLGQSIGIVGALIIGQAAIAAGIVSTPMVVVVSLTAVANFALPHWGIALTVRLLRFPLMLMAATFGGPGILVGLLLMLVHLSALRSFGVPYLYPLTPLEAAAAANAIIRPPRWVRGRGPRLVSMRRRRLSLVAQRPRPPRQRVGRQ